MAVKLGDCLIRRNEEEIETCCKIYLDGGEAAVTGDGFNSLKGYVAVLAEDG